MKLFRYNQFLYDDKINENLDKAKKFLKDKYLLDKAVDELGILKDEIVKEIEHGERGPLTINDFSNEEKTEISKKLKEIKLTPETIKEIEKSPVITKVRELKTEIRLPNGSTKVYQLDKDNMGWLSNFVYFHVYEGVPLDLLSNIYKKLILNKDIINNLTIEVDGTLVKKAFDLNFINPNIINNNELLTDALDRLEQSRKIKKMYDILTPELKASYNSTSELNKSKFEEIVAGFDQIGKNSDGTFDEDKKQKYWNGFFGSMVMRDGKMVYASPLKRYKDIDAFIKSAQNYLKSTDNDQVEAFYSKIETANKKLGNLGADIVFNENGIVIVEVKSFQANQILNGHTSHCIKDSMYQWESYVSNHNNKQYYLYNFNVPQYDNNSTVGITIEPGQNIKACHNRPDARISDDKLKSMLKEWQEEYEIDADLWSYLQPMSDEEIKKKERSKLANREIIKKGLTIEQINQYVKEDGADINKDSGMALLNAVEEDDIEKVKVILELGASPNLKTGSDAPISKAKNIDMIKLLVDYGAIMTGDVFASVVHDVDALKYTLKAGMDPTFGNNLPLRKAFTGTYNQSTKEKGDMYYDSFLAIMEYIKKLNKVDDLRLKDNMIIKWAGEYGRIKALEYWNNMGIFKDFTEKEWKSLMSWVRISRKLNENDKNAIMEYIESIMS